MKKESGAAVSRRTTRSPEEGARSNEAGRRRGRAAPSLIAALLSTAALALMPASCGQGDGGTTAELIVIFTPNPVRLLDRGWPYRVIITESAGIGVNISRFRTKWFSPADVLLDEEVFDSDDFEEAFDDCGGSSNLVPGGGVRCGDILDAPQSSTSGGYTIWQFFGIDALGNEVSASARVDRV